MVSVDRSRLLSLVDALRGQRVAVVGDLIADEFIYGQIARVSREAPVLILNYDSTEIVPGEPATPRRTPPPLADPSARSVSPVATSQASG